jgi:polar amino acid transport system substrate-binding protein
VQKPGRGIIGATVSIGIAITTVVVVVTRVSTARDLSLVHVQQAGEVVVGLDPSYPPFAVDNVKGEVDGLDVELTNELSRRLGVKARLVTVDFGGIYDALNVGKFDLIVGGVTESPDEEKRVAYSRPYFDDGLVVVAGPESSGKALGIENGSDADLALASLSDKLSGYSFRPYDDQDQIHAAIVNHSLRGAIVDRVTAAEWAGEARDLTVSPVNLTSVPYVIGARRGDGALLGAVDRALQSMIDDGFVAGLERKWLRT